MSVLIKGMEMPTSCWDCDLCYDSFYCKGLEVQFSDREDFEPSERRLSDCPLLPVPDHGDLIERDAALESLMNGMVMTGYQSRAMDCVGEWYVPTIIPADKEEQT